MHGKFLSIIILSSNTLDFLPVCVNLQQNGIKLASQYRTNASAGPDKLVSTPATVNICIRLFEQKDKLNAPNTTYFSHTLSYWTSAD